MTVRRVISALAVCGALGWLVGGHAAAADSVESGWWTSAPVALAPDVDAGRLLVQGGSSADAPLAYAGISFSLADGESPSTLVLQVAPNAASTPAATLSVCALGSPAFAAHGEPADTAPSFDCGTKSDAAPSADGTTYEFDVAPLAGGDDALDVAVVPTRPTDRVVLVKPDATALRSDTVVTDTGFDDSVDAPVTGDPGASDLPLGAAIDPGPATAFDLPALAAPAPAAAPPAAGGPAPAPQPDAGAGGSGVGRVAPVAAQQDAGGGSRSLPPLVFVGLLVVAAVLWGAAGTFGASSGAGTEFR